MRRVTPTTRPVGTQWHYRYVEEGSDVGAAAALAQGVAVIADYGNTVHAIDPDSGEVFWNFEEVPGRGDVDAPPVVTD